MPTLKNIGKLIRSDIRLPEKVDEKVEDIAKKESMAKSSILRRIVCDYFNEGEEPHGTPVMAIDKGTVGPASSGVEPACQITT